MHRGTWGKRVGSAVLALIVITAAAGCSGSSAPPEPKATTTTTTAASTDSAAAAVAPGEVVKEILGTEVDPPGGSGRTLTLIRYRIGAGAKLAPHVHPGVQMASIESGQLTYTVVKGTAIVRRAGASSDVQVPGPNTITLKPGDTVTEVDGMVHFGANDTKRPVVILATLLTKDGADLAVPVTTIPAAAD